MQRLRGLRARQFQLTSLAKQQARRGFASDIRRHHHARICAVFASNKQPKVLVADEVSPAGIDLLRRTCDVETSFNLTEDELCAKVPFMDALIVRRATHVTRAVFEASRGRLKVVGRAGVGVDNVDLAAATEYGCLVVNAPTANTVAAAEHAIALLCALARNVPQADAAMKSGRWDRKSFLGCSIAGKTLAIYGYGKIGSEVARRARGLGLNVLAYDPYASTTKAAAQGVRLVSFDDALASAAFHSLHMPLTPVTRGLFGDSAFGRMRPGSRLINLAAGCVMEEGALLRALESGVVAGAALDVFDRAPLDTVAQTLLSRNDVIATPHLGSSTHEAQEGVALEVVGAVVDALAGNLAVNAVNAPMVPSAILRELQPYIVLAEGLGKAAVGLVAEGGFGDVSITYSSPRGDDLDTRLLRAMVIKGVLEDVTTARVNLVNADLLAKNRGLRITEVLTSMSVALGTASSRFSSAVDRTSRIYVEGKVVGGSPFLTKIGNHDVELGVAGSILLTRQRDQPGIVGRVGMLLAEDQINISYMTVSRIARDGEAIMAIGIDLEPSPATLEAIGQVPGVVEVTVFKEVVPQNE